MKKTLSIILSLVLALSCLMAITPVTAMAEDAVVVAEETIIKNGGFENDLEGWKIGTQDEKGNWYNAEGSVVETVAKSGSKSFNRVNSAGTSLQYNHLIHQIITLEANTLYEISFWVKGNTGWGRFYISDNTTLIDDRSSVILEKTFDESYALDCADWTRVSAKFMTNSATEYRLSFRCIEKMTNFYLDDVAIVKSNNHISNPSFEEGMSGWTDYKLYSYYEMATSISSGAYRTGASSLRADAAGERHDNRAIGQKVTLKPNSKYKISFYAKGYLGYGALRIKSDINAQTWVDSDTDVINQPSIGWLTASSTDWAKYTYYFYTNDSTNYIVSLTFGPAAVDAYFDDFSIVECSGILENGGFEEDKDGWTWYRHSSVAGTFGDEFAEITEDISHNGDAALHYSPVDDVRYNNSCIMQNIKLEANTDYKLSFWMMGQPYYGKVMIHSNTAQPWVDDNTVFMKQFSETEYEDFTKQIFYFTTDDRTDYILSFAFAHPNVNLLFDDIVIEKRVNDTGIIQNPGFEDAMGGWSTNASGMKVEATSVDSNNGDMSLHRWLDATTYNQSVYQKIKLEANTKYKLSYYVKGNPSYGRMRVSTVNDKFFDGTGAISEQQLTSTYAVWTKVSGYFYTNDATEYILSWTMQAAGDAYFDDFEIVKADGILNNGSFEDGMDEWVITNDPEVEVDSYEKHSGNNSLYFDLTLTDNSRYNRTVSQDIKLQPYTEYTIKMWVKGHPGWGKFFIQDDLTLAPHIQDSTIFTNQLMSSYDEWTEISFNFITNDVEDYRLVYYFSSPDTDLNIDDIEIKATGRVFNADDVVTLKKFILGADVDATTLDVTGDGKVNILDLIRLKKIIASLA